MTTVNKRFYELDYLRGLAAISVVLFHFTYGYDNGLNIIEKNKFYLRYGNAGVYLFFMISGFVIFMTLNVVKRPMDFLVSRFSRLYPGYWASLAISILFCHFVSNPFGYNDITKNQVYLNITMFQYFFNIKNIDGAYWTLAIELMFYALLFLMYIKNQLNNINKWCFGWLICSFVSHFFSFPFQKYISSLLILKFAPLFISGIMFYQLYNNNKSRIPYFLLLLCFFIESLYLFELDKTIITPFIVLIFYVLFYVLIHFNLRTIKPNSFLYFFGTISYSLYLIHENIGLTLIYHLKKILDSQFFYIPIAFVFVVFLATLITFYIEKPAMKLIKKLYFRY